MNPFVREWDMTNRKTLRFEVNLGSLCNFRCCYCFENGDGKDYTPTKVSIAHLKRYADYINYLRFLPEYKDYKFIVVIYGGEPLLQLDKVEEFIKRTKISIEYYGIVTNAYLVNVYKEELLHLCNVYKNIRIDASFDFVFQNETRQKDSYERVRENIQWMYANGMCKRIITTFSMKNFHRIHEVYEDFKKLQETCPNIKCVFNIDRFGTLNIDEEKIRESLSKIPNKDASFVYNDSSDIKRSVLPVRGCFYCRIYIAMCENGSLYPGYEFLYESEKNKELFYIGHIEEQFEVIHKKHKDLVAKLPTNPKKECIECSSPCRVFPWRVIKDDLSQCWDIPEGDHCKIHKLIGEYL